MNQEPYKPLLFCFAGPSASGKTTLTHHLVKTIGRVRLSVSTTTRQPRAGEQDGVDYFFVSPEEFRRRVNAGCFLEHAEYSGNSYGTEKLNIKRAQEDGVDLLLDIEVQGVSNVKKLFGNQVITIFVFPKSFSVLQERLVKRHAESQAQMEVRLQRAKEEVALLSAKGFSDYLLINDDLDTACRHAQAIVEASRMQMTRWSSNELSALSSVAEQRCGARRLRRPTGERT